MLVTVYKRDSDANSNVVGSAVVTKTGVHYIIGEDEIKDITVNSLRTRDLLGEDFDENNLEHWNMLPKFYSGSMYWVTIT